jgi:hypothetical protein
MQGIKTTPEEIIPQKQEEFRVLEIVFRPQRKIVIVKLLLNESTLPEEKHIKVDVSDEWVSLTLTRRNNWKAMFKVIVAKAVNMASNEITGEIWD